MGVVYLSGFSILLLAAALFSQNQREERVCTVQGVIGTVKVFSPRERKAAAVSKDDINTWPDVRLNMSLREKDEIRTMAGSEVRLELADGSIIKISENTAVEMSALKSRSGGVTNTKVNVVSGNIVTNVKKLANSKSSFEVQTPTALATIRGTFVEVEAGADSTQLKTFEGVVRAAPANSKKWVEMNDYQMMVISPNQKDAAVQEVSAKYRPKSTRLLNEEEAGVLTGYMRVFTQYSQLEQLESALRGRGIPCAIGIGESSSEMTARTISADDARTRLANSIEIQVQRLSESYAQNVGGEAKKIWEESVRQITNVNVRGSTAFQTINQYNDRRDVFKTYTLMVLNPVLFKEAVVGSMAKQEEFELRVKKDDMMVRLDAAVKEFGTISDK